MTFMLGPSLNKQSYYRAFAVIAALTCRLAIAGGDGVYLRSNARCPDDPGALYAAMAQTGVCPAVCVPSNTGSHILGPFAYSVQALRVKQLLCDKLGTPGAFQTVHGDDAASGTPVLLLASDCGRILAPIDNKVSDSNLRHRSEWIGNTSQAHWEKSMMALSDGDPLRGFAALRAGYCAIKENRKDQ